MSDHMREKGYYKRQKRLAKKKAEEDAIKQEIKIANNFREYGHGRKKHCFLFAEDKSQEAKLNRVAGHHALERVKGDKWDYGCLKGWNPKTKSVIGILISLIKHFHETYPVPRFLYNAFLDKKYEHRDEALLTFHHLTKGGKSKDLLGTSIDAPLTKRMLHFFLSSKQPTFVGAIREAQFRGHNGDPRVLRAFITARPRMYGKAREKRYNKVIEWLSGIGLMEAALVGPMLDFFDYKFREEPDYSLKGRTINSVMDAVHKWHRDLNMSKITGPKEYPALESVSPLLYEKKKKFGDEFLVTGVWTITPILDANELRREGKALGHCVAEYGWKMGRGHSFIWSMKENGTRAITIEVNNHKEIIQARGRRNRVPTETEKSVIRRWAKENQLTVRLYYW